MIIRLLKWQQCFWVKMLNTPGALPEATSLNVDCMYLPDTGSGVSTPNLISQISFQLSTRIYVLLSAIMKIIILLSFGCVSFSRTGQLCHKLHRFITILNRGGRPPGMNSSTYIHEDTYYRDSLTSRRAMTNVSNLHRSPLDLSSRQKTILITIC